MNTSETGPTQGVPGAGAEANALQPAKKRLFGVSVEKLGAIGGILAGVGAIIVGIPPLINSWVDTANKDKVSVSFVRPSSDATLTGQENRVALKVNGYADADTTLWVAVEAPNGFFYPLPGSIDKRDGEFDFPVILGRTVDAGDFKIVVLSLDISAKNAIVKHLERDPEGDDGLNEEIDGAEQIASLKVHRSY